MYVLVKQELNTNLYFSFISFAEKSSDLEVLRDELESKVERTNAARERRIILEKELEDLILESDELIPEKPASFSSREESIAYSTNKKLIMKRNRERKAKFNRTKAFLETEIKSLRKHEEYLDLLNSEKVYEIKDFSEFMNVDIALGDDVRNCYD